jgi:hypothetical protein
MSVNTNTNVTTGGAGIAPIEGTTYGTLKPPVATAGFTAGDKYYATPDGTFATAGDASVAEYTFDGTQWVANPQNPKSIVLNPELGAVKDFQTQAQLDALAAATPKPQDQVRYIVSDGSGKSNIAMWSVLAGAWIYYTPVDQDVTTVTAPDQSTNYGTWQYNAGTDTWVQITTTITLPEVVQRVVGPMNIVIRQDHNQCRNGSSIGIGAGAYIMNDGIIAFGASPYLNSGDASASGGVPRKLAIAWGDLNGEGAYSAAASYIPIFTEVDYNYWGVIALDHKGKVWTQHFANVSSGQTTTATANVVSVSAPSRALHPCKFFQGRDDIVVKKVYINGHTYNTLSSEISTRFALDTQGRLWGTGYNIFGELGLGDRVNRNNWFQFPIPNIKAVKARQRGSYFLTTGGDLYLAGQDSSGAKGTVSTAYSTPQLLLSNVVQFEFSELYGENIGAVKADGTLWVSGTNATGQLGRGNTTPVLAMAQVAGITNAKAIFFDRSQTSEYSVLIRTDGTVSFAGRNRSGLFGYAPNLGDNVINNTFVTPTFEAQGTIIDCLPMFNHAYLRTSSGDIWVAGQVGGSGVAIIAAGAWATQNVWKKIPLPEPVVSMEGMVESENPNVDGVRFATANRGFFSVGSAAIFNTNTLAYSTTTVAYREMGDLRTWDTGIAVTAPAS